MKSTSKWAFHQEAPPLELIKSTILDLNYLKTLKNEIENYHFRWRLGDITWISIFRIWFQKAPKIGKFIWVIWYESSVNGSPWTLFRFKLRSKLIILTNLTKRVNFREKMSWKRSVFEVKMVENLEIEDLQIRKKVIFT